MGCPQSKPKTENREWAQPPPPAKGGAAPSAAGGAGSAGPGNRASTVSTQPQGIARPAAGSPHNDDLAQSYTDKRLLMEEDFFRRIIERAWWRLYGRARWRRVADACAVAVGWAGTETNLINTNDLNESHVHGATLRDRTREYAAIVSRQPAVTSLVHRLPRSARTATPDALLGADLPAFGVRGGCSVRGGARLSPQRLNLSLSPSLRVPSLRRTLRRCWRG